jgi:hypothetical protein
MKWVQLALVEKDPATFDPDAWLDLFQRVHADGVCISAGGMGAFYPTEVPFHHRSDWLGDKDTFGSLVRGWRKLNMAVIARVVSYSVPQNFTTHGRMPWAMHCSSQRRSSAALCTESFQR